VPIHRLKNGLGFYCHTFTERCCLHPHWSLHLVGGSATDVLDNRLYRMALEKNKVVHQLETVDEQVDVFEGLTESDQVALLG